MESAVRAAVADYNNAEIRKNIPYTIHSRKHPDYANRTKPQVGNIYPDYNGAVIRYHKDVEEMVEAFFMDNQLDGKIIEA